MTATIRPWEGRRCADRVRAALSSWTWRPPLPRPPPLSPSAPRALTLPPLCDSGAVGSALTLQAPFSSSSFRRSPSCLPALLLSACCFTFPFLPDRPHVFPPVLTPVLHGSLGLVNSSVFPVNTLPSTRLGLRTPSLPSPPSFPVSASL